MRVAPPHRRCRRRARRLRKHRCRPLADFVKVRTMRNTFRHSFATVLTAGLVTTPLTAAFAETDGSGGVASGNQIVVPVDAAVDICGNAVSVLGISAAESARVSGGLNEASGKAEDAGTEGADSGDRLVVPVDAAGDICGNSVAILGSSTANCTTVITILHAAPETEADAGTDGSGGVASGNQIVVPVDAAVDICGNAVSVLGMTEAGCMETISEGSEDDEDEGQEDDGDSGQDEDEGQEDDKDSGQDEDEGQEDDKDDKGDEDDSGKGDEGDDKPAPSADG